jgi:hypothetical protein
MDLTDNLLELNEENQELIIFPNADMPSLLDKDLQEVRKICFYFKNRLYNIKLNYGEFHIREFYKQTLTFQRWSI